MGGNLSNQGVKKMKKLTPIVGALFFCMLLISACAQSANPKYDGYVFVRATDIKIDAWTRAGWVIDINERSTDILLDNPTYPPRCTLFLLPYYPKTHVGYCIGTTENPVEIPIDGTWDQVWVVVNGVNVYSNPPTPVPSGN